MGQPMNNVNIAEATPLSYEGLDRGGGGSGIHYSLKI